MLCVDFRYSEIDEEDLERNRPVGHGPFPKCRYLHCYGGDIDDYNALDVPDMVNLIEVRL